MSAVESPIDVAGPFYEDLEVGQVFDSSPGLTVTEGHGALHQAIVGDRLRLGLDRHLAAEVIDAGAPLAHPGLVCDVAIGQSTLATQRVIANLFYRGLVLRRSPRTGDTLRTTTEVVALRDTSARPGRAPTGLAALRVRTVDHTGEPVLDYHRCAMLPMRDEDSRPGHAGDLDAISSELDPAQLTDCVKGWNLARFRELVPGPHGADLRAGTRYLIESGDTVTSAPELVRLTLNVAAAHSDPAWGGRGRRLVYGGHTIGLALSHVTRAIPNLVTVSAWRSCDHLAPVFEGDVLRSIVTVESSHPATEIDGWLADLRVQTRADRAGGNGEDAVAVLDWRLVAVLA
jgi:acyl dehydratase